MVKTSFQKLYEIADSQRGYFTAKQATMAGYSTRMQTYHEQVGDWEREWRGIYRLKFYPNPLPNNLMVWYLWSSDRSAIPKGVFSHDTALELHQLSTWASKRIHLTVPKDFRRQVIPKQLKLYKAELQPSETTKIAKLEVTTVVRTLLDLLKSSTVQKHHLVEAMCEARKRGLIIPSDLQQGLTSDENRLIGKLFRESQGYLPDS